MAVSFSLVNGTEFASEASSILEEAWDPPALRYTPTYLSWQLSFPSELKLPAVAAFEGGDPIGFAAATSRKLRSGSAVYDAAVVSFVAVRSNWRGQGIASGLYRLLLKTLADLCVPVITFAIPGSQGHKALLRGYSEAGFHMQEMGIYDNYAFISRSEVAQSDKTAHFSENFGDVPSLAASLALRDDSALWSAPESLQMDHYFSDPRPRKLVVVEHAAGGICGAGFVVHAELRTAQGITRAATLDSVWMPSEEANGLQALLRKASVAWPSSSGSPTVVMCPNLCGFDAAVLRATGVRKTGAQFCGYLCTHEPMADLKAKRTNLEIL